MKEKSTAFLRFFGSGFGPGFGLAVSVSTRCKCWSRIFKWQQGPASRIAEKPPCVYGMAAHWPELPRSLATHWRLHREICEGFTHRLSGGEGGSHCLGSEFVDRVALAGHVARIHHKQIT
jgi:hypothetical protein